MNDTTQPNPIDPLGPPQSSIRQSENADENLPIKQRLRIHAERCRDTAYLLDRAATVIETMDEVVVKTLEENSSLKKRLAELELAGASPVSTSITTEEAGAN